MCVNKNGWDAIRDLHQEHCSPRMAIILRLQFIIYSLGEWEMEIKSINGRILNRKLILYFFFNKISKVI